MPAKYVLTQKGERFHWNLLATNGRTIASSEAYGSKAAAMAGIRSVQKNGATDVVVTADELAESRAATKRPSKKAAAKKAPAAAKKATGPVKRAAGAKKAPAAAKKAARSAAEKAGTGATTTKKTAASAAKRTTARKAPTKKAAASS